MDNTIKTDLLTAAQKIGVKLVELSAASTQSIRKQLDNRYTTGQVCNFLWESLISDTAIQNVDAWQWIKGFVGDAETILMFDRGNEENAFLFRDGSQVVPVLAECYYAYRDCYLTDKDTSFVLCFNHHDFLIACGRATVWLQQEIQHHSSNEK